MLFIKTGFKSQKQQKLCSLKLIIYSEVNKHDQILILKLSFPVPASPSSTNEVSQDDRETGMSNQRNTCLKAILQNPNGKVLLRTRKGKGVSLLRTLSENVISFLALQKFCSLGQTTMVCVNQRMIQKLKLKRDPSKSLNHAIYHINFDEVYIILTFLVVIKLSFLCHNLPEYDGTLIWELAVPSPPSLYARTSIMQTPASGSGTTA